MLCSDLYLSVAERPHGFPIEDLFDNRFFGISSNEASAIDPQQRHHLEVAYAACHDAGKERNLHSLKVSFLFPLDKLLFYVILCYLVNFRIF